MDSNRHAEEGGLGVDVAGEGDLAGGALHVEGGNRGMVRYLGTVQSGCRHRVYGTDLFTQEHQVRGLTPGHGTEGGLGRLLRPYLGLGPPAAEHLSCTMHISAHQQ